MRLAKSDKRLASVVVLLLFAWGLRLCRPAEIPPGWRDDELINIYTLSGKPLEGDFPLYFTGASGHEPLYHYLHAGVLAVLGHNVVGGHILSVAFGTLGVALTYALARRLFPQRYEVALVASLGMAFSFWSLMYSRFGMRHISAPAFALAIFYANDRMYECTNVRKYGVLVGLLLGLSLYTYPAARLLPVLLVAFAVYLALFHRERFRRRWRGFVLALAVMVVLAAPLGVAIARGRTAADAEGIGADARLAELAVPLRELRAGNPRPLLETTWTTLGMFHATGDPEWLYNIPGRPVFNLLGGVLLWAGVVLCLLRWREPRYFFLLLWLGVGLSPAFVSIPPASLSHTILAQPVAYLLPALALAESYHWLQSQIPNSESQIPNPKVYRLSLFIVYCSLFIFLAANAVRDLRDYFVTWPRHGMTRMLYRADYRQAAGYLNTHPEIADIAISSALLGPWDRLALETDVEQVDVSARLFNPERALIWTAEPQSATQNSPVLLTSWPDPSRAIEDLLKDSAASPQDVSPHLKRYTLIRPFAHSPSRSLAHSPIRTFSNGLALTEVRWLDEESLAPGREAVLLAAWRVAEPLDLPPMPVVANPPPPGVYSGPRLSVFAHLLDADGEVLSIDDGLWVDPLTLEPGDRFVQIHRFAVPESASGDTYALDLGLYDPKNGERWPVVDARGRPVADRVTLRWMR